MFVFLTEWRALTLQENSINSENNNFQETLENSVNFSAQTNLEYSCLRRKDITIFLMNVEIRISLETKNL